MSVGFIRSNVARKVVSVVCLLTFPAVAQQANTGLTMQATPVAGTTGGGGSQQSERLGRATAGRRSRAPSLSRQAPLPEAPQVKSLPQPTHVDYSKPTPLLPNPFARYIPRDVPPPAFTNAPKIEQLDPKRKADALIQ